MSKIKFIGASLSDAELKRIHDAVDSLYSSSVEGKTVLVFKKKDPSDEKKDQIGFVVMETLDAATTAADELRKIISSKHNGKGAEVNTTP